MGECVCEHYFRGLQQLSTVSKDFKQNIIFLYINVTFFLSQGGKTGAVQKCVTCRGRGMRIMIRQLAPGMVQQMQSVCTDCNGEGENSFSFSELGLWWSEYNISMLGCIFRWSDSREGPL